MRLVDTHLHLVDRTALAYPWLEGVPALNKDYLYETYRSEAARCGITDVLHMEVDVREDLIAAEVDYVAALAARRDSLIRGAISACRPEQADFPAFLERQAANPLVKGFRRILHVMPDDHSETPLFRANIRRLAATGHPFDLCVLPHQIEKAIALVDLAPDVAFVLDHCGVPAIKDRQQHPWHGAMADIARRPNVIVKISGVIAYADPQTWALDDIRPYVEHAIDCFGWDRVVWGSDWPVCTLGGSLSTWVAATQALVSGASADERRRLFADNAIRTWRLSL